MPERRADPDSYLAEIDRRLEAIEGELRAGEARPTEPPARRGRSGPLAAILGRTDRAAATRPPEPAEPVEPAEPPARGQSYESSALVAQLRAMSEQQARLIVAIEALLELRESQIRDSPSAARPAATGNELSLSAGPFAGTEALHAFEHALADLPGVRQVEVRGYEGVDQAVFAIELDRESPPDATA
jgi:hypothetical protein